MSLTPSSAGFPCRHTARTSPWALLLVGFVTVGAASGARAEQSGVAARVLADLERERQKETEAARRRASNLRGGSEPADLGRDHDVADAAALRRCLIFGEDRLDFFARAHLVTPYADPLLATDVADAGLTADVVDHLVQPRVLLRTVLPAEVRVRDDRAPASKPLPDGMPVEFVASSCLAGHVVARVGGVGVVALPRDAVGTVADWQQRLCSRARALPAAGPRSDDERRSLVHQLAAATRGLPPRLRQPAVVACW